MTSPWAAGVVQRALIAEQNGRHRHDRITVTSGPLQGRRGYVVEAGWYFDDPNENVEGPAGYVVDLDDTEGTERVDGDQVKRSLDLKWADRPAGCLKANPPAFQYTPSPRVSCEQDVERLLAAAANAETVPEQLRRTIAGAREHHHLQMDWQATPEPNRHTWQVLWHWYQLTEQYADDQRADLYEIIFTRHRSDDEPVHYLALSEEHAHEIIEQHISTG